MKSEIDLIVFEFDNLSITGGKNRVQGIALEVW